MNPNLLTNLPRSQLPRSEREAAAIHVSDLTYFLNCQQLWTFRSPLAFASEARQESGALGFGRMIHRMLAYYYSTGKSMSADDVVQAVYEEYGRSAADPEEHLPALWGVWKQYVAHMGTLDRQGTERWRDDMLIWNRALIEIPFTFVPVPRIPKRLAYLEGRVDAIVQRADDGTLWLVEHKTSKSIDRYLRIVATSPQPLFYIYALRRMGYDIKGVMYNFIRSKPPTVPGRIRGGIELEQNKQRDTTLECYVREIRQLHNIPEDGGSLPGKMQMLYGAYLEHLWFERRSSYNARLIIEPSAKAMNRFTETLPSIVRQMLRVADGRALPTHANNFNCISCPFFEPCTAYLAGDDAVAVGMLESAYSPREQWHIREEFDDGEN